MLPRFSLSDVSLRDENLADESIDRSPNRAKPGNNLRELSDVYDVNVKVLQRSQLAGPDGIQREFGFVLVSPSPFHPLIMSRLSIVREKRVVV